MRRPQSDHACDLETGDVVKVVLDTSTGMDLTQDDDTFEVVKDGEVMLGGQFVGEDAAREAFDKLTLSVE